MAAPVDLTLRPGQTEVQQMSLKWAYSLENRERWARRSDTRDRQASEMQDMALAYGVSVDVLEAIVDAGLVEVEIPFVDEERGWELRIMPWEYLLASATRLLRRGKPFTVVRYLRTAGKRKPFAAPKKWHYVESAAAELRGEFGFDSEYEIVRTNAVEAQAKFGKVCDPDASRLFGALAKVQTGDVVHFAGFDSHQGLKLLGESDADSVYDGYLVQPPPGGSKGERPATVVAAWELACALTSGNRRPRLTAFNLYYSAGRTAALAVALGADAAIGFQDVFDDALAELFFATFYRAWRVAGWNTAAAFRYTWDTVRRQQSTIHGSGVVLWSGRSIRETLGGYWGSGSTLDIDEMGKRWSTQPSAVPIQVGPETIRDLLEVEIEPLPALNYSVLHNGGSLFKAFVIRKTKSSAFRVQDIHIRVELHVGTDSFPFRTTVELGEDLLQLDLEPCIRISLASALSRALRECVRTSLFVELCWGDVVLRRATFPITLLPIDEWLDTDVDRIWLPSFVLPRDPAVPRIISHAQRYLMALSDDPTMGFSGYQSVDPELPANASAPQLRCEGVDAQVRAIWASLLYEFPLYYINPPPVFSEYSQRLRTPSDVVDGGRGTCIDLALLLASCLEYVEIYPVVFLLRDHAFPGYWRDEAYYSRFLEALAGGPGSGSDAEVTARSQTRAGQRYSWYLERVHFREILAEVHAGRLVPLETVALTERVGFATAMERGLGNLTSRREFQALLDVISARWDERTPVTPLPLVHN